MTRATVWENGKISVRKLDDDLVRVEETYLHGYERYMILTKSEAIASAKAILECFGENQHAHS